MAEYTCHIATSDTTKNFSEWEECHIPVILNISNKELVIMGIMVYSYKIGDLKDKIDDLDRKVLLFEAQDNKGNYLVMEFVYYKKSGKDHLYLRWRNITIVYQLKRL